LAAKQNLLRALGTLKDTTEVATFIRFVLVGIFNTAFGYTVFAIVYLMTAQSRIAIVFATMLGVIFTFFSNGRLVFGGLRVWAFLPFLAGYAVICTGNMLLVDLLARMSIGPMIAQLLALVLIIPLSYGFNRYFVFMEHA
jgi:putative flippase GtrA